MRVFIIGKGIIMGRINYCYSYDEEAENCPLISVVITVYNGILYLQEAIQSLLDQTFVDFELILLDDCSSDGSVDLIKSYTDPRIKLVQNSKNLGIAMNTNLGLAIARGRYIAFMGHDDISLPERLQIQYGFMESNPTISICGSWLQTFGRYEQVMTYPINNGLIKSKLLFSTTFGAPSVIIRKKDFVDNKLIFRHSYSYAEDYDIWVRAASIGLQSANIPQVLVKYRVHDTQVSSNHHGIQLELTARIQLFQLRCMGIDPLMEELQLHFGLSTGQISKETNYLEKVKNWFIKIDQANQKNNIYPQSDLRTVLNYYWNSAYQKYHEAHLKKID
jgi:glycosyltransferase involved in cell wall biosynthesis